MFEYRNIEANAYQPDGGLQQKRRSRKGEWYQRITAYLRVLALLCLSANGLAQSKSYIIKKIEIRGGISPKSVVSSHKGLFAAQNMMYRHSITVYNELGNRLAKIKDGVNLKSFGFNEYENKTYLGGPVEAAFTKDGKYLWVSNYTMVGPGFENPGCDACIGKSYDPSFLYKINCKNFEIESVVKVGSVPKYIAISPNQKLLLVSNWTSSDISVVDLITEKEIKKVHVGAHPRGVDITADSKTAYVTIMGSTKIAEINLVTYEVSYIKDVGRSPRHLILSNHDSLMYVSLNSGNKIIKYDRHTHSKEVCKTSSGPRSMCISPDGDYLYCVNYFDNSFSKIETKSMTLVEEIETAHHPIGISANWDESEIWVACYSGKIEVFKDFHLDSLNNGNSLFGFDLSTFWSASHPNENKSVKKNQENSNNKDDNELLSADKTIEDVLLEPKLNWSTQGKLDVSHLPKKKKVISVDNCTYHVICGSFSILANAHRRRDELINKGYSAEVIIGSKLNYVSSSCHGQRDDALTAGSELKLKDGYSSWILKR